MRLFKSRGASFVVSASAIRGNDFRSRLSIWFSTSEVGLGDGELRLLSTSWHGGVGQANRVELSRVDGSCNAISRRLGDRDTLRPELSNDDVNDCTVGDLHRLVRDGSDKGVVERHASSLHGRKMAPDTATPSPGGVPRRPPDRPTKPHSTRRRMKKKGRNTRSSSWPWFCTLPTSRGTLTARGLQILPWSVGASTTVLGACGDRGSHASRSTSPEYPNSFRKRRSKKLIRKQNSSSGVAGGATLARSSSVAPSQ